MVCEKNSGTLHNFDTDPIVPVLMGKGPCEGTTLGSDDGIGIAASLAILSSNDIPHGPIESCLPSTRKQAFPELLPWNLDSCPKYPPEPGFGRRRRTVYWLCRGIDTVATFRFLRKKHGGYFAIRLDVKGLLGGHSGDDIHKNRGNAIKS
jgi:dipeptidase D